MQKALRLSQVFGGLILLVFLLFSFASTVNADTVFEDIKINLGIEIGNEAEDYEDADLTIEKGRFVTYRIKVTNSGANSHNNLMFFMDSPIYMEYVPDSTVIQNAYYSYPISDVDGYSPLETGYSMSLGAGEELIIDTQFQVFVDEEIKDESLYTFAFASVFDEYSGIPVLSEAVETTISGEAKPTLQGTVEVSPDTETTILPGMQITYTYDLNNVGGLATSEMTFVVIPPENTTCISGCGEITLDPLDPNGNVSHEMIVQVNEDLTGVPEITGGSATVTGEGIDFEFNQDEITHSTNESGGGGDDNLLAGEFMLIINQVPNVVLNSADGMTQRPDGADLTETQYSLLYGGRGYDYTYPDISDTRQTKTRTDCSDNPYIHPHWVGAYFYAYNSNGSETSESLSGIGLTSSPIEFHVNTVLPETSPKLEFTVNTPVYSYDNTDNRVNEYMQNLSQIDIPGIVENSQPFTESRAVTNGAMGIVSSTVTANVIEEKWQYQYSHKVELCTICTGSGEDQTCRPEYRPVYTWQKVDSSAVNLELKDDDNTHISVYTSTAWLKTQGGHIGTNGSFTNNEGKFNEVDLILYPDKNTEIARTADHPYIRESHLTKSYDSEFGYTPPWAFNAEYFIFGNEGTGEMKTNCGKEGEINPNCDDWYVEGTEFPFLQRGDAYDRENNPRNYDDLEDQENNPSDLINKEKFGEVRTNELSPNLSGTVELGDDIIWHNTGDIRIGSENDIDDVVTFNGGQSRIYTTGDVYIYADIKYGTASSSSYNDITSVRIDARNIYVEGEVEDLEVMLLAREGFYSGVSKKQLRILGDVIAKNTFWQREPLLEYDVEEINKPSEYIIEDMRKYIVPVPGDTTLPDDYTIWRQVNPSTGEVLDSY